MSDEKFIDSPPQGLEGWRRVWLKDLRYRGSPSRALAALRRAAGQVVHAAAGAENSRQRNYNIALLEMLTDLRSDLGALAADQQKLRELIPIGIQRNDALIAAIDRKVENLSLRVRDLTTPLLAGVSPSFQTDFVYRRLEDALRGSSDEVREQSRGYVDYARKQNPAVDVGCGRGEFLALCREEKIEAFGFDSNERSVAELQSRGLRVELASIPGCFSSLADSSVGSVLAAHVVEHLPFEPLVSLFAESARVLRSGGFLMIETPNAGSLRVSASEMWRDPTHLAPRHVAALVLIAREFPFDVEETRTLHPFPPAEQIEAASDASDDLRRLIGRLNEVLYGDRDLRLVLRKR